MYLVKSHYKTHAMIYEIYRVSSFFEEEKPCNNAIKAVDPSDEHENIWAIEINSLDDLLNLQKEVDAPIILFSSKLEIYDGYRE